MRNLMNDKAAASILEMVEKALEEQGKRKGRISHLELDGESTFNLIQEISDYLPLNVDVLEEHEYTKPYMAFWGEGYEVGEDETSIEEKKLAEFSKDKGYRSRDIKKISELQVGEVLDLTDELGNVHLVKRLW